MFVNQNWLDKALKATSVKIEKFTLTMKKIFSFLLLSALTVIVFVAWNIAIAPPITAQETLTTLTARKDSLYYQAATELNALINKDGLMLKIQESPGSFSNLQDLGSGKADLAFAQQDVFKFLRSLSDPNLAKLAANIKVFAPVSNEVIHILVNRSSGINTLADLKGKSVAIGPEDSGTNKSAILLYQLSDIDVTQESLIPMEITDAIAKVKTGEIDAAFYTAGLGAPLLKNLPATDAAKLKLLSIDETTFKSKQGIFREDDDVIYVPQTIPAKTYAWQSQAVNAVSTFSFLYINQSVALEKAYKLAKSAYPQAAKLKAQNRFWQAFGVKEAKSQRFQGLDYHAGVKQFLDQQKA